MLFKPYDVYENKLSEKLPDDNPYKKKLIEMETPKDKHPVYSFLIFSLSAYCLVFLWIMLYNGVYGSLLSVLNLAFVFYCISITYKKDYLIGINPKYRRNTYIIYFFVFCFSWLISATDYGYASYDDIIDLLVLKTINHKSYIALALVAYTALGISMSFYNCPYELYRAFYSLQKTYSFYKNDNVIIRKFYPFLFVFTLALPFSIFIAFNKTENKDLLWLKNISFIIICISTQYFAGIILARKYFKSFKQ